MLKFVRLQQIIKEEVSKCLGEGMETYYYIDRSDKTIGQLNKLLSNFIENIDAAIAGEDPGEQNNYLNMASYAIENLSQKLEELIDAKKVYDDFSSTFVAPKTNGVKDDKFKNIVDGFEKIAEETLKLIKDGSDGIEKSVNKLLYVIYQIQFELAQIIKTNKEVEKK